MYPTVVHVSPKPVEKMSYEFTLTNIVFPTIRNSKFRLISTENADENEIIFKIERLGASQQWQTYISDIDKLGPSGFPKDAVLKAFKHAIQQLIVVDGDGVEPLKGNNSAANISSTTDPYLEAKIEDGGAFLLTLYLPVMGYPVDFPFRFLPVAREQFDILESALRDAGEEIERLKNELKTKLNPFFIVLRSSSTNAGLITWNMVEENTAASVYVVSTNYQEIQVNAAGLYQISVRITAVDNGGSRSMAIRVNGTERSCACNGCSTTSGLTIHLLDIICLNKGDKITTYYTSTQPSNPVVAKNQFWILKIA